MVSDQNNNSNALGNGYSEAILLLAEFRFRTRAVVRHHSEHGVLLAEGHGVP